MLSRGPQIRRLQYAKIRWTATLFFGFFYFVTNVIGVEIARRNAFELNGIELSAMWYAYALFIPGISIVLATLIPRTHTVWDRDLLATVLMALMLASFGVLPIMYVVGGFK